MKIPEHGIGLPVAKQPDEVSIDVATQECHCAGTAQDSWAEAGIREVAKVGVAACDELQEVADGRARHVRERGLILVVAMDRGGGRSLMHSEVGSSASQGTHWAEDWVAARRVAHLFPPNRIFLLGKG